MYKEVGEREYVFCSTVKIVSLIQRPLSRFQKPSINPATKKKKKIAFALITYSKTAELGYMKLHHEAP